MKIEAPETVSAETLEALARAAGYSTDGAGLADMLAGTTVFEMRQGGQVVGAFALQAYAGQTIVQCTAAGATAAGAGMHLLPAIVAFAEQQARRLGATVLTFATRRPGLVRQMQKQGFHTSGYILRRDL